MRIHFTRHGESQANIQRVISNRDLPHPLTAAGRDQARALAERLKGIPLTHICSSPVPRALETAEIIGTAFGLPIQAAEGLKEYDCGILEGRGDEAAWAVHKRFFLDWLEGRSRDMAPEGGETFFDIRNRLGGFLRELADRHGGSRSEILCVSHGGTLLFGLPGLFANVDLSFVRKRRIGHASIISAEDHGGKLFCTQWDDVPFGF